MRKVFSKGYVMTALYVGIAMLLVVLLIGRGSNATVEKEGLRLVQSSNEILMQELADHIGYRHGVNLALCRTVYNNSEVRELLSYTEEADNFIVGNVIRRLQGMLVSSGMIDSIMLYNGTSDQIYSTDPMQTRCDLKIRDFLKDDRNTQNVLICTREMLGLEKQKVLSYIMVSRRQQDQSIENAVVLNISVDRLLSNLTVEQARNQRLMLVSGDGAVLADTAGETGQTQMSDQVKALADGENQMSVLDIDGDKTVVSYCDVRGTEWKLVSYQPYDMLYGMVDRIRQKNLWIMCAVLVFALILTAALSYILTRPLASLIKFVQEGHTGDTPRSEKKRNWKEMEFLQGVFEQQQRTLQQYEGYQENTDSTIQKEYLRNALLENGLGVYRPINGLHQAKQHLFAEGQDIFLILLSVANLQSLKKDDAVERDLIRFIVCNITNEILEQYGTKEVLPMSGGNIIVLLAKQEADTDGAVCRERLNEMIETVSRLSDVSVSAFVGERSYDLNQLGEYYGSLRKLNRYTLIYGSGSVLFEEELKGQSQKTIEYPEDREKAILAALNRGDEQGTLVLIADFLAYLGEGSVESYLGNVHRMLLALQNYVAKLNQHRLVKLQIEFGDILSWIQTVDTGEQVYQRLRNIAVSIMDQMPSGVNQKNAILIKGIREYIDEHYSSKELCAKMLAGKFGLSQTYLGVIFKEGAGCSVQEYINHVRLEHAQNMVLNTELLIGEIMELCGFEPSSFYRIYKGYFGVSPKEQRMQKRLEEKEEKQHE